MIGKYKVITLCGSTRFKDEFMEAQKRLTLEGNIVISVGLFGHSGDNEVWENMDEGKLTATKEMLDDMHKSKIDMADEIFVINVGGYIGNSTRSEIEYAKNHGKAVRYLEQTTLDSINDAVEVINSGIDPKTGEHINIDRLLNEKGFREVISTIYHRISQDQHSAPVDNLPESSFDKPAAVNGLNALMEQASALKSNKEWENAIILLTDAINRNPNERDRAVIVGDIVRCYIEMGAVEQANSYYINARKEYGKEIVDAKMLTYIASVLEYRKDYLNAKKYALEAFNLSKGKPSQALVSIINRLKRGETYKPETKAVSKQRINTNTSANNRTTARNIKENQSNIKSQGMSKTSQQERKSLEITMEERRQQLQKPVEQEIKRSCNNCKLYIKGDCAGINGPCDDYEYAPVISDEEKKTWPASMQGPYGRNYGQNRRR